MNIAPDWRAITSARRIQIFVSDLGATGVVRNAIAIANEAAASGYQVRLLTCNAEGVLRGHVRTDVPIVKLNETADALRPRRMQLKKALIAYRRHTRLWTPDIMLSAGNHGHLLSSLAWLGLPGTKLLRISNDLVHGSPSRPARIWREWKFSLMARLADRMVYVSRALGNHPLLGKQLASGKAMVIPNGVDIGSVQAAAERTEALPADFASGHPIVLAVGRHAKQKNFDSLLRAFALARAERPMRLMFLGDGSEAEIARLKGLARQLGVEGDVSFIPAVQNPFPYMAAAAAVVLPSLWEGSSNVLLEAMACGTPVIASHTAGDAGHVLGQGRFGVLVQPCDAGQLAAAILRQTGAHPVLPAGRAESFDRGLATRRFVALFDTLPVREAKPARAHALATH